MIRREACRQKISEIKHDIETLGNSESQIEYKRVLQRQLEGWQTEYKKALMRDEPEMGNGGYSWGNPRIGKSEKIGQRSWE